MTISRKRLAALFCVSSMILCLVLFGCSGGTPPSSSSSADNSKGYELINEGKLIVAASLDFPPFENLENGQVVGFTVELMGLLAEEMDLEPKYLPSVKFDTIIPMVSAGGKADVGASSLTITSERKKEVDFTDPYCDVNQSLVVTKDADYKSVDDFTGKKIGTQAGTTGYDYAVENIKGAEVIGFDEATALFAALQTGQINGIVIDLPVAQYYVKNEYQNVQVLQEIPTGEQYGIAVSKDNPKLTEALNTALKAVKTNGKYDELYEKWFG